MTDIGVRIIHWPNPAANLATLYLATIAVQLCIRIFSLKPRTTFLGHAMSSPPFHFDSILSCRFVILGLELAGPVAFGFVRTGALMCLVMSEQRMALAFHRDVIRTMCIYLVSMRGNMLWAPQDYRTHILSFSRCFLPALRRKNINRHCIGVFGFLSLHLIAFSGRR